MMIKRWIHKCCGVVPLLHAAHIDPWSKNKKARLSFENGLLLLSTVHKLFDEGLISFRDDGSFVLKEALSSHDLKRLGLPNGMRLGNPLTADQKEWMRHHREEHRFPD
jgi:putative restriction endonuclease